MTPARRTSKQFGGTPADALVVGLGNPGREYEGSRHNVGFEVIDELARRWDAELRTAHRQRAAVAECRRIGGGDGSGGTAGLVVLAAPRTYMNLSGEAVAPLARRYGLDGPAHLERVIVVHDELDLPAGRLRVKLGGGIAGHNGLRSIKEHLGSAGFARVRIGVGKPPDKSRGADHVLRRVGRVERALLDRVVQVAADAVECIVTDGLDAAMNAYNGTDLAAEAP